jgi:sulfate transport system ATP-binding protein
MSVRFQNVTKRFTLAGTPAVSDVSFEAPKGAVTAILGPSGAGKSTVLRLAAGLEFPDSGSISIEGADCSDVPIQKRGIGLVFQNYALFRHMTVRENIAFGLKVRRMPRRDVADRVTELLGVVQLEGLGDRYPGQLSGGQQQRVAFARALAVQPKVLLLDEPFGALDVRVRRELREWLDEFHGETGVTTLLVTHDQSDALELAEHVVVMFDGRVAQAGPPHEIYDHPETPLVASFVGGANLLTARVRSGSVRLDSISVPAPAAEEGELVQVFVRPHDVELRRASPESPDVSLALVERLKRIGGYVRVSLLLRGGENLTVESSMRDFELLAVGPGDRVLVDLKAAKLFALERPH